MKHSSGRSLLLQMIQESRGETRIEKTEIPGTRKAEYAPHSIDDAASPGDDGEIDSGNYISQPKYCGREGCENPLPKGRRKYCSMECSKIVNRKAATERSKQRAAAYRLDRMVKFAPRTCLSCGRNFMSEGPWNRICGGCGERNSVYSYTRSKGASVGRQDNEEIETAKPELVE